jgi:hypothetical protein
MLALLVATGPAAARAACPFCCIGQPTPLRAEAKSARLVLVGTLSNPRRDDNPNAAPDAIVSDFRVRDVIKDDPVRAGRTLLAVHRNGPANPTGETLFLVFVDIDKGKLDFYRGIPVSGEAVVPYLRGSIDQSGRTADERLLFFFRHVDSPDPTVAEDAFLELSAGEWPDLLRLAPRLDRAKLRRSVADPKAPANRVALFATLLGATGSRAEAKTLADLLDREPLPEAVRVGALSGLFLLDRPAARARLTELVRDPRREFLQRYAAVRVSRFLADYCPGVLSRNELAAALDPFLEQSDMADLVVDQFRKWCRWEKTDRVLALTGRGDGETAVRLINRAVLRFALSCPEGSPERARAAPVVDAFRKQNTELIQDVEESLRLENEEAKRNGAPPLP